MRSGRRESMRQSNDERGRRLQEDPPAHPTSKANRSGDLARDFTARTDAYGSVVESSTAHRGIAITIRVAARRINAEQGTFPRRGTEAARVALCGPHRPLTPGLAIRVRARSTTLAQASRLADSARGGLRCSARSVGQRPSKPSLAQMAATTASRSCSLPQSVSMPNRAANRASSRPIASSSALG